MYLCNCEAIRQKAMDDFLEANAGNSVSVKQAYETLGKGSQNCGRMCAPDFMKAVKAHNDKLSGAALSAPDTPTPGIGPRTIEAA